MLIQSKLRYFLWTELNSNHANEECRGLSEISIYFGAQTRPEGSQRSCLVNPLGSSPEGALASDVFTGSSWRLGQCGFAPGPSRTWRHCRRGFLRGTAGPGWESLTSPPPPRWCRTRLRLRLPRRLLRFSIAMIGPAGYRALAKSSAKTGFYAPIVHVQRLEQKVIKNAN